MWWACLHSDEATDGWICMMCRNIMKRFWYQFWTWQASRSQMGSWSISSLFPSVKLFLQEKKDAWCYSNVNEAYTSIGLLEQCTTCFCRSLNNKWKKLSVENALNPNVSIFSGHSVASLKTSVMECVIGEWVLQFQPPYLTYNSTFMT